MNIIDLIIAIIFILEVIMKTIVQGFVFNGPDSYIHDGWNKIDFLIAILSIVSHMIASPSAGRNVRAVSVIRAIRALRLILLLNNKKVNLEITSLINSLPGIANLLLILLLTLMIFAILGVNLYKGRLWYCYTDNMPDNVQTGIVIYW